MKAHRISKGLLQRVPHTDLFETRGIGANYGALKVPPGITYSVRPMPPISISVKRRGLPNEENNGEVNLISNRGCGGQ